ncbi:MAG: hypothetical protein U5L09_18595 [Bacteroidales bacterium]|nr:hypothetical protein [Bacteroidales bacterium]
MHLLQPGGRIFFDQLHHGDYEVRAEITHGCTPFPSLKISTPKAQENITVNLLIKDEQVIADIPEDLYNLRKKSASLTPIRQKMKSA